MRQTRDGQHHFMFLDAGEILRASREGAKWMKHQNQMWRISIKRFEQQVVTGEQAYVARADAVMREVEGLVPMSRGYRNRDDVVGSLANVPAYLAGIPQAMRRRERVAKDNAPLTIFMDLATSAGISADNVLKRGIVLLALTRLLVEHRPVELWVGTMLDDSGWRRGASGTCAWRIDTTPLDLARAAFHIADVAMSRLFGYAMCETMTNCHLGGSISAEGIERQKRQLREIMGWHEVLYIPAMHLRHPMVSAPGAWLKEMMQQYVARSDEDEAA